MPGICGTPGTHQGRTDSRPCLQRQMMTPVHPRGSGGGGDAGAPGRSEWMGRVVSEGGPRQREQAE